MKIDDQIKDSIWLKIQNKYDINTEVAKISALSCGEIDKHEYFTGE